MDRPRRRRAPDLYILLALALMVLVVVWLCLREIRLAYVLSNALPVLKLEAERHYTIKTGGLDPKKGTAQIAVEISFKGFSW